MEVEFKLFIDVAHIGVNGNIESETYDPEDWTDYTVDNIRGNSFLIIKKHDQWVGMYNVKYLVSFSVINELNHC